MKIDGASAHSINFIEQKKSTASSSTKNSNIAQREDSFINKNLSSTPLLELNESLGMLQIANTSISKLEDSSKELQKLNEKFSFFQSQESEFSEKFEEISTSMLDIVDNTTFKDTALFYSQQTLNIENSEFSFSVLDRSAIEDFSLGNVHDIDDFTAKLQNIKDEISRINDYIKTANFNQVAVLNVDSSFLDFDIFSLKSKEIEQVHDTNLLKDKMSFLLD